MGGSCWKPDLNSILTDLINVALRAGTTITTAHPDPASATSTSTGTKNNSADLVTETDKLVEKQISATLCSKYPTFKFLGEETYKPGMKLGPEPTFVVDPIDGTTNFVHGWPYVSVSLGFAVNREPVVGIVFNPFTGKMYGGVKGHGSWVANVDLKNSDGAKVGRKARLPLKEPTILEALDGALVAIEWGSDREGSNWACKTKTWTRLGASKSEGGAMIHSARALGSAALNLCAVADGSIDAYWEGGCWAWDVCAGSVVLKEAGGCLVSGNPGIWDIEVDHRKYLAMRGMGEEKVKGQEGTAAQRKIVEEFWSYVDGEMVYES